MDNLSLMNPAEGNSYYDSDKRFTLASNLIYVFGSNTAGIHGAGAAREAKEKYGAIYGRGFGLAGRSFAIPTKDESLRVLPLDEIEWFVDRFKGFIEMYPEHHFYVTPIGTGLAGYKHQQIAPMFRGVKRCWLPAKWALILEN